MTDDELVAYLCGDSGLSGDDDGWDTRLSPAERAELDSLREVLSAAPVWVDPNPALEDRIVAAIADATGHPAVETSSAVVPIARAKSRRVRYAVIGVAAAVVLAVGIAIAVATTRGSKPTEFAASMTATQLAQGASGDVTLTQTSSGWRIRLNVRGLPRLDNGRYYEAWLKDAHGALVAVGTFNEGVDVTLWAGVPPSSHPTLTITRQAVGGGPGSSGQVVLIGMTHRVS